MAAMNTMPNKITVSHDRVRPIVLRMWFMQILFWVILTVVSFFSLTLWYGSAEPSHVMHTLLQSIMGVAFTLPMHWVFSALLKRSVPTVIAGTAVVVLGFSLLWSVFRLGAFIVLTEEGNELWADFGGWYFSGFFIFLCWTAIYYSLFYYRIATEERDRRIKMVEKSREEKLKRLRAEKIAVESRMQMLRYQINPHFLFNTLNAVNALIVAKELTQARATVEKLSQFLRYALRDDKKGWVKLVVELEALELYLGIERVRFADRLTVNYHVDQAMHDMMVPSLLLQPLVENSIKYAVNVQETGCVIDITTRLTEDALILSVSDNGPGIVNLVEGVSDGTKIEFSGVGLKNIFDRLQNVYGGEASVTIDNKKGKGLTVTIRLPRLKS